LRDTITNINEIGKRLTSLPHLRGSSNRRQTFLSHEEARDLLENSGFRFPDRARRISCMMCKGGVGKTTTAFFLAQRLVSYGSRVLVIDSDPQSNLTEALHPEFYGFRLNDTTPVLVDVLTDRCNIEQAILPLTDRLHLLPSTAINSLLETKLVQNSRMVPTRLDSLLRTVDHRYDFVVIDCAPSLNILNALVIYASSLILLPVQLDGFSSSGLKLTLAEIKDLERNFKFRTQMRILVNKFNPKEKLSFLFLGHLAKEYRSLLLNSTIRNSVQFRTALTLSKDLFGQSKSKPREDFDSLAREILFRTQGTEILNA
jgi:chromosome partitioning protein